MTDGDDLLRKRYRDLGAEEPPAALDKAILSAAQRAVAPRSASQRWAIPVSLAAVLVLAVGVTLRMQQETPGIETTAPASEYSLPSSSGEALPSPPVATQEAAETPAAKTAPTRRAASPAEPAPSPNSPASRPDAAATPSPATVEKKAAAERRLEAPIAKPQPKAFADTANQAAVAPAPAAERFAGQSGAAAPRAQPMAPPTKIEAATEASGRVAGSAIPQPTPPAAAAPAAPVAQARAKRDTQGASVDDLAKESAKGPLERELDRIAQLRRDGRNAEADEALEKFRRENPAYRIPDTIWEQVKPR